jgi:hypothetical protein
MSEGEGEGVEKIYDRSGWECTLLAVVVRGGHRHHCGGGGTFFTEPDEPLQVGVFRRPAGHEVEPHAHRERPRTVRRTQEVLAVRGGRLRVTIYGLDGSASETKEVGPGDLGGGHGLEVLEDAEFLEVKLGPYVGRETDKYDLGGAAE